MKCTKIIHLSILALQTVLGETYVYIYVPTKWKNDVDFTGGKMTDGQMYQPSLCNANSKVEQKSEEDCQDQPHYSPRDQIMFDKPKDVRLIDINMPGTKLSCNVSVTKGSESVYWLVGYGLHSFDGVYRLAPKIVCNETDA